MPKSKKKSSKDKAESYLKHKKLNQERKQDYKLLKTIRNFKKW